MGGSVAEERIRTKVEAALKAEFPDARIVHELNMQWGGIRLDLAAVRPDSITLVEIKSERDVLKRLRSQIEAALLITGDVRVYVAEKHRAELLTASRSYLLGPDGHALMAPAPKGRGSVTVANPDYIRELHRCRVRVECDEGFADLEPMPVSWWVRRVLEHLPDPRAMLELLWREELVALLCNAGISPGKRPTREPMKRLALEYMTGRQIRLGVCAALRGRPFARAEEAA